VTAAEVAGRAWAFRYKVEVEAALRFDALAQKLATFDAQSPVVAMLRAAAEDERRHVELCRAVATPPLVTPMELPRIAPDGASVRDEVLYEVIAACCVAETESVATLTVLLKHPMREEIERVVREIARDEVRHAKLGWAHLAREAASRSLKGAGAWLPAMLTGSTSQDGFKPDADHGCTAEELHAYGVLPLAEKKAVFHATMNEVVLPGLEHFGVDTAQARRWLESFPTPAS
jgi:hypothetical protein